MITRKRRLPIAALVLLAGFVTSPASALTQSEIQKLLASDGLSGDEFGRAVALDGDTAVIGTFAGAIMGELSGDESTTVRDTLKPATGATIGRILGTLSKLPIAMAIWAALTTAAFWP